MRVNAVPTSAASSRTRSLYVDIESPGPNLGSIIQSDKISASVASASVCAILLPERDPQLGHHTEKTRTHQCTHADRIRIVRRHALRRPPSGLAERLQAAGTYSGSSLIFDVTVMNAMNEHTKDLEPSNDAHIPIRSNNKKLPARRCKVLATGLLTLTAVSDESWRGIMFAAATPMNIRKLYSRDVTVKGKRHVRTSLWPSKKQHRR